MADEEIPMQDVAAPSEEAVVASDAAPPAADASPAADAAPAATEAGEDSSKAAEDDGAAANADEVAVDVPEPGADGSDAAAAMPTAKSFSTDVKGAVTRDASAAPIFESAPNDDSTYEGNRSYIVQRVMCGNASSVDAKGLFSFETGADVGNKQLVDLSVTLAGATGERNAGVPFLKDPANGAVLETVVSEDADVKSTIAGILEVMREPIPDDKKKKKAARKQVKGLKKKARSREAPAVRVAALFAMSVVAKDKAENPSKSRNYVRRGLQLCNKKKLHASINETLPGIQLALIALGMSAVRNINEGVLSRHQLKSMLHYVKQLIAADPHHAGWLEYRARLRFDCFKAQKDPSNARIGRAMRDCILYLRATIPAVPDADKPEKKPDSDKKRRLINADTITDSELRVRDLRAYCAWRWEDLTLARSLFRELLELGEEKLGPSLHKNYSEVVARMNIQVKGRWKRRCWHTLGLPFIAIHLLIVFIYAIFIPAVWSGLVSLGRGMQSVGRKLDEITPDCCD